MSVPKTKSSFVSIGHKDSVTCALFSHDSSMVATGDMSGLIKVWKVETKEEVWSFEVGDLEVRGGRSVFSFAHLQGLLLGIYQETRNADCSD